MNFLNRYFIASYSESIWDFVLVFGSSGNGSPKHAEEIGNRVLGIYFEGLA